MINFTHIRFCPACGSTKIEAPTENSMHCLDCRYVLFHNTAAATAILLKYNEKFVFVRRGKEPAKGMLDLPGGFVDYNESAEQGILREIREETGFTVHDLKYFGSAPNKYIYKQVTYHTCDLLFTGKISDISSFKASDEVPELVLLLPSQVDLKEIAFNSLRNFVSQFIK